MPKLLTVGQTYLYLVRTISALVLNNGGKHKDIQKYCEDEAVKIMQEIFDIHPYETTE